MTINPNNLNPIQPRVPEILPDEQPQTSNQTSHIAANQGITNQATSVTQGTASKSSLASSEQAQKGQPSQSFFGTLIGLVRHKINSVLFSISPQLANKSPDLTNEKKNLSKQLEEKIENELMPLQKELAPLKKKSEAASKELKELRTLIEYADDKKQIKNLEFLHAAHIHIMKEKNETDQSMYEVEKKITSLKKELNKDFGTEYKSETGEDL